MQKRKRKKILCLKSKLFVFNERNTEELVSLGVGGMCYVHTYLERKYIGTYFKNMVSRKSGTGG